MRSSPGLRLAAICSPPRSLISSFLCSDLHGSVWLRGALPTGTGMCERGWERRVCLSRSRPRQECLWTQGEAGRTDSRRGTLPSPDPRRAAPAWGTLREAVRSGGTELLCLRASALGVLLFHGIPARMCRKGHTEPGTTLGRVPSSSGCSSRAVIPSSISLSVLSLPPSLAGIKYTAGSS